MTVNFKATIIESKEDIKKMILREAAVRLNNIYPEIAVNIKRRLSVYLGTVFINTPEYAALTSGDLDAHFGIPQGTAASRMHSIISVLQRQVEVEIRTAKQTGTKITGGMTVYAVKDSFDEIFGLDAASVEGLPWLQWLMIEGNRVIITNHQIMFTDSIPSRSGAAIMIKSDSGFWKVPSEYAGTENDNWVTRAIDGASQLIRAEVQSAISEVIRRRV